MNTDMTIFFHEDFDMEVEVRRLSPESPKSTFVMSQMFRTDKGKHEFRFFVDDLQSIVDFAVEILEKTNAAISHDWKIRLEAAEEDEGDE